MRGEIRQEYYSKTKYVSCNVIWLLKTIRGVMFKFKGMNDHYLSIIKAKSALNRLYQDCQEKRAVFYNRFVSVVDAFENYGGTMGG